MGSVAVPIAGTVGTLCPAAGAECPGGLGGARTAGLLFTSCHPLTSLFLPTSACGPDSILSVNFSGLGTSPAGLGCGISRRGRRRGPGCSGRPPPPLFSRDGPV